VVVAMVTGRSTSPETLLAEVVVIATLAFVAESHESFSSATITLDRMKHLNGEELYKHMLTH